MPPGFTVLLCVVRPPDLIDLAIASVLAQTRTDFELLVICDGAPEATVAAAREAAARDARIRVFPFPKGERHGEFHRHAVLQEARGRFVCHIADDDLWLPQHLEGMAALLEGAMFGHGFTLFLSPAGKATLRLHDIADTAIRSRLQEERWNYFGPTCAGYRLDAYRRLPVGWAPAPPEIWTDLHMWRKFLAQPGITCATRFEVSTISFPTYQRKTMSLAQRRAEMGAIAAMPRAEAAAFVQAAAAPWEEALRGLRQAAAAGAMAGPGPGAA
jgi:glycosyltransferase involved in cell wall biosynthesis